jgi:molybdate transport system substrate-binding protein
VPGLTVVDIPDTLNVPAEYGLTVLSGAKPQAVDMAAFILSPRGQAILGEYGFAPARSSGK